MQQLSTAIRLVIPIAFIMWIVYFLDAGTNRRLARAFRLTPRSPFGLVGVFTCPFFHVNQRHLWGNTLPFVVLGSLIAMQGVNMFIFVSTALIIMAGLITWLLAPGPGMGASGVIFGYLGYLLMYGMTVDDGMPQLMAAIGLITYGSIWIGVFPRDPRISWIAHAAGFISGLMLGYWLGMRAISLGVYGG